MKKIIFIALLILFSSMVMASAGEEVCNYLINDLGLSAGYEIPSGVPYSNENFLITTLDDELVGHLTIENKKVTSIDCTSVEDQTYTLKIKNIQTINEIINAKNPIKEFNAKLKNKEIIIEGATKSKRFKAFFTKIGLKIASWFS